MTERVLLGPFLTRSAAADVLGVPPQVVGHRPDLLRVGGRWLPEVYFAFQFDRRGVRRDIGAVVSELRSEFSDIAVADWLVRPNGELNRASPLAVLNATHDIARVLGAARGSGPAENGAVVEEEEPSPQAVRPSRGLLSRRVHRPAPSH